MKFSELFYTIQGEGKLIGVPSVFFRTSYCNLRCVWCFVGETPVLMADFTEKPIQAIRIGDKVLSVEQGQIGILCESEVTHTYYRSLSNLAKVATPSGDVITTPQHKFKTECGWTPAQYLSLSVEKLSTSKTPSLGEAFWIEPENPSLSAINAAKTGVFNLTIENTHCYFANRFLVSNCDTPYTSWKPENRDIGITEAVKTISGYDCKHVVITGGEPFIQVKELMTLCDALNQNGHHITIETNATVFAPVAAHLISMSPKLRNSNPSPDDRFFRRHERGRICPDVIRKFLDGYECQVKFVVDSPEDLVEIKTLQAEIPIPEETIVLMPQGITADALRSKQEWLVACCKEHGYRYSPRVHVDIWGDQRGV